MKRVSRDGRKVYVAGRWSETCPTAASSLTTEQRAQLREFLQSQADGPLISAGKLTKGKTPALLRTFAKRLGGEP